MMGLNIVLCDLSRVKNAAYPWPDIHHDERFDSSRFTGDREFFTWLLGGYHGECRTLGEGWDTEGFVRLASFPEARAWVRENIIESNQQRWLDLFDLLEADQEKHLWLQGIS